MVVFLFYMLNIFTSFDILNNYFQLPKQSVLSLTFWHLHLMVFLHECSFCHKNDSFPFLLVNPYISITQISTKNSLFRNSSVTLANLVWLFRLCFIPWKCLQFCFQQEILMTKEHESLWYMMQWRPIVNCNFLLHF